MKSSWFLLGAFVAACPAWAQNPAQIPARRPDLTAALDAWRAEHGAEWQADVDQGTGFLEMLFGSRTEAPATPRSDAEWFALARRELAATEAMHGLDASTLVDERAMFLPLGLIGTTDKMAVRLRQAIGGVPVDGGCANVLFDARGAMLAVHVTGQPRIADFDVQPKLTANTASERAASEFLSSTSRTPTSVGSPELVVAQIETPEQRIPVLAWRVTVLSEPASGDAKGRTYWIDAVTGGVAKSVNAIRDFDVSGNVSSLSVVDHYPDEPGHPATPQTMKYARLTSSAGVVTTDANGNFNFPGATAPLSITCSYAGTYNSVVDQAGPSYSLVFNATNASGNNIVMNSPQSTLVTAQSNVFYAVNVQRDFVRSINPVDSLADYVHTANVNIANQCNAYFNGGSINFYQAGGSCANTAYPSIAYHENGHWLNVRYGTSNDSTGMGEGNADMWAMYIDDDPVVGHDFAGIGNNVRTGLNTRQFCGDVNLGCYQEEHADGEVWMGAGWKIRRNLESAYGVAPGGAIANALFLGWMEVYNQQFIQSIIETQWLTLDDDDGVLGNGTPHYAQIDPAFREQGFPGYPLFPVAVGSVTKYPDTQNQIGPYNIDATVIAYQNPPLTSVTLAYKFGSGAYTNVAMSNIGGNVYRGQIPGHLAPAAVTYYVTAANIGGQTGINPTTAPAIGYRFDIGAKTVIFSDNFEGDLGWTVSNTALSTGAWERNNPNGTIAQPEDDNPLGSGTQCYFTQNAAVGQSVGTADVDGGPTTLTSPAIDFSSTGAGSIKYAYWFYNDSADDSLVVQVSNGGVWVTARTYTQGQSAWMYDSVDVGSFVTPNATVRIRFSTADNPNDSITEAAIDDVIAATLSAIPCPVITTYCTAKTNSLGCVPSIGSIGTPTGSGAGPFEINVSQVLNNKTILLFYGYQQASAPFFGGTRCIAVPLLRTGLSDTGGNATGNDCSGVGAFDFEALIQSGIDSSLAPGISPVTQFYYRDPADPFTVGLSNALQFRICP